MNAQCPGCGSTDVYVGMVNMECPTEHCINYNPKQLVKEGVAVNYERPTGNNYAFKLNWVAPRTNGVWAVKFQGYHMDVPSNRCTASPVVGEEIKLFCNNLYDGNILGITIADRVYKNTQ